MAWIALALYLLGVGLAFGWRSVVHWRRTGDAGWRLDAGRVGSLSWTAKVLFVVAMGLGLGGPLAAVAGLDPIPPLNHSPLRATGLGLAILGVGATLAAQTAMGASWRIGVDPAEQTTLVTQGAFAFVRNPIFSAMTCTSLGLAAMVPNAVSLAAAAVLILAIQVQVRAIEEPYLLRTHGSSYQRYAATVGRFLPGLGKLHPTL